MLAVKQKQHQEIKCCPTVWCRLSLHLLHLPRLMLCLPRISTREGTILEKGHSKASFTSGSAQVYEHNHTVQNKAAQEPKLTSKIVHADFMSMYEKVTCVLGRIWRLFLLLHTKEEKLLSVSVKSFLWESHPRLSGWMTITTERWGLSAARGGSRSGVRR